MFSVGFRNNVLHIINPVGNEIADKVLKFCNAIDNPKSHNNIEVVIKKASEQVVEELLATNLFAVASENLPELLEDESFPENVLDLEFTFPFGSEINSRAQNLGKKYRSFEKIGMELHRHDDLHGLGNHILYEGLRSLSRANHNKWLAYKLIIDEVSKNPGFYKTSVFTHNGKIHGIYIAEPFQNDDAGLYCAITSREYQGMTEWMDVVFFKIYLRQVLKDFTWVVLKQKAFMYTSKSYCPNLSCII